MVASGVQFLRYIEWYWTANIVGALMRKPAASIQTGLDLEKGKEKTFQHFGMNPMQLQEWQKEQTPILALHGKNGTQWTFLKMGEYFEKHQIGPFLP